MDSPLITAVELHERLAGPESPSLLDVRWDLAHGPRHDAFADCHIPGAVFIDLAAALAGAPGPDGSGGRHPLPEPADFTLAMQAAGVSGRRPVVAYDDTGGLAAARAWWLLRHHGHPDVVVLDGGLQAWRASGGALATGPGEDPARGDFTATPGAMAVLDAEAVDALGRRGVLLDARAPERFRGESEPVDPVAGHIPGARNRPTTDNLDRDGCLLPAGELREAFTALGADAETEIGVYCGSGVTAAHQLLALEAAGLSGALYAGSWSDWISEPARPVAVGPDAAPRSKRLRRPRTRRVGRG